MSDLICRTVNGGVHRLKDKEGVLAFIDEIQAAEGKSEFVKDIDGRWINTRFIVEVWEVGEGAGAYGFV